MNKKMIMRVIWSDGEVTKSLRCFELRLLRRVDRALVIMMVIWLLYRDDDNGENDDNAGDGDDGDHWIWDRQVDRALMVIWLLYLDSNDDNG